MRKSFGELEVLRDIGLSVAESEVISIIGPSGSGKSTFLRCISMLETVDRGSISYCGETAVDEVASKNSQVQMSYDAKSSQILVKGLEPELVSVYTTDGKPVACAATTTIPATGFNGGLYIVKATKGKANYYGKVMVE